MRRRFRWFSAAAWLAALAVCAAQGAWSAQPEKLCPIQNFDLVAELTKFKEEHFGQLKLSAEHLSFLEEHVLPASNFGRHLLELATTSKQGTLEIGIFPGAKKLVFEWVEGISQPEIHSSTTTRTLKIPKGFDLSHLPENGNELLRHFFIGHPLQPYASLPDHYPIPGPAFTLKPAQLEGVKAVEGAIARGDRTFLYVAPTGLGKTEVFMAALKSRIEKPGANKLHVVLVDQIQIASQLANSVKDLKTSKPIRIIEWGGASKSTPIDTLVKSVENANEPTVLVTTIQSLKARMKNDPDLNQAELRKVLDSILFDEVHHAGAEEAQGLIQGLVHHPDSRAFFYGTTATPKHRDVPLIETLFGSKAFWAKLDSATDYLSHAGTVQRDFDSVFNQLSLSIKHAELSPLSIVDFADPTDLQKNGIPVFVRASDQTKARYVLNPEAIQAVIERTRPIIERNESGFVSVATIEETQLMAEAYSKAIPNRKFEALHSQMPKELQDSISARHLAGEINYLITVKKLDEGLNIPGMSSYIDLNRSAGMRQILQRIGRVVRLRLGKEGAEVFAFFEVNGDEMLEKREFLERIQKGELQEAHGKNANGTRAAELSLEAKEGQKRLLERLLGYERNTPAAVREQIKIRQAAEELLDFYIENDGKLPRPRTPSDASAYAKMHALKGDPEFQKHLEVLPELHEAVAALTPHKERLSLGKRGPKPAAELTERFMKEMLETEGKIRLPDPKRDKREDALLRWIKNYYKDTEYQAGLSEETKRLLDADPRVNEALRDPNAPRRGRKPRAQTQPEAEPQQQSQPEIVLAPTAPPTPVPVKVEATPDPRTKALIEKSVARHQRRQEKRRANAEKQAQRKVEIKRIATEQKSPEIARPNDVAFSARAEDDWKRLPESAKAVVAKRALAKISSSPMMAGILNEWGGSTTKTRSVVAMDKHTEYRVIYVMRDNKPVIVMVGSKDDVNRGLSARLNGLK